MNNDYDRGEEPRYTMTSFNKQLTSPNIDPVDLLDASPAVKLLLLKSGDTIISVVEESMCGTKLKLKNPRIAAFMPPGSITTTPPLCSTSSDLCLSSLRLYLWMPLAKTRTFDITMGYVVTSTDPIDSLVEIYLESDNG